MRVDHIAYQRALHITIFGLVLQALTGSVLLVFSFAVDDTPGVLGAMWCLLGLVPWLGLLVIFAQHRLERLEALEEDELSSSGASTLFERSGEAARPAARRLRLTYRWILPCFSAAFAIGLVATGWFLLDWLRSEDMAAMELTSHRGWMAAIVLGGAAMTFVFSRYLAGMAGQSAWRHLRAGAGQMVSCSLVLGALAIGIGFRFFDVDGVVEGIAWAVPILMFAAAIEIVLSLILDAYRPRRAGEFPRASFDSPSLSLLAQPGSMVRSINEAVNYQFGFDITSSWGYQLLLRSGLGLGGLAVVVLLCMSTVVVIGPREEGLRLSSGAIVGEGDSAVFGPGPFLKLPWPLETSRKWNVTGVRTLPATPVPKNEPDYYDWREPPEMEGAVTEPAYIVRPSSLGDADFKGDDRYALVVPDIRLAWRIQEGGLLQYLDFVPDRRRPRQSLTDQQRALQLIAKAEMTRLFATLRLDQVLSTDRNGLGKMLKSSLQARLNALKAGIDIVAVEVPEMRPPKDVAIKFESLPVAVQQRDQWVATARRREMSQYTTLVGDSDLIQDVIAAIDKVDAARDALDAVQATAKSGAGLAAVKLVLETRTAEAVALLRKGGGAAWQAIAKAKKNYWVGLMDERADASLVRGQEASWRVAPELYRQRAIMQVYSRLLPSLRKYVVGVDPERLDLNIELREHASPNTVFSDAVTEVSAGRQDE